MSMSLQKQHHITQLLSTAAAGNGVVGDVDALLTPIQISPMVRTEPKAERNLWREEEMLQMLNLMLQANAIEMLNDKSVKSEKVFRNIEKLMFECGYRKKSFMQIWTKWKFLKSTYMTSRRAGIIPKMIPPSIYHVLDTILRNARNVSSAGGNSNGAGGSSLDGETSDSGRLIISHVESGCLTNGSGKGSKKCANGTATAAESSRDPEDDSGFDMAHPIFGFRLGMVKQEPVDAGYEASSHINATASEHDPLDDTNANSPDSSLANTDFASDIKQELMDADNRELYSCTSRNPRDDSPSLMRPGSPLPLVTSTPEATLHARDAQMPPLRIAPFAKAPHINMQREQQYKQQQFNSSPPPLSMHPIQEQEQQQHQQQEHQQEHQHQQLQQQQHQQYQQQSHRHFTRQSQAHTTNANKNKRKESALLQKAVPRQYRVIPTTVAGAPIRLPRDITIHQTRPSASTTAPRLKQTSMQQLNYGPRHPETVLTDIGSEEITLQQQKMKCYAANYAPTAGPSTSQQAAAAAAVNGFPPPAHAQRKRRLQLPYINLRPAKVMNMKKYAQNENMNGYQDIKFSQNHQEDDDDIDGEDEAEQPSLYTPFKQNKKSKQHQKHFQRQEQAKAQRKTQEDFFEAALKQLGTSLRSAQREIMDDFFQKQMEMVRAEHEFQARQDNLLIKAFAEQTQLIMESAKTLLGIDLSSPKKKCNGESECNAPSEDTQPKIETENEKVDTESDRVQDRIVEEAISEHDDEGYEQQEDYLDDSNEETNDDEISDDRNESEGELGDENLIKTSSADAIEHSSSKLFEKI